jgi:hypothetical protein
MRQISHSVAVLPLRLAGTAFAEIAASVVAKIEREQPLPVDFEADCGRATSRRCRPHVEKWLDDGVAARSGESRGSDERRSRTGAVCASVRR